MHESPAITHDGFKTQSRVYLSTGTIMGDVLQFTAALVGAAKQCRIDGGQTEYLPITRHKPYGIT